jgi:hypothetical protein
MKLLRRLGLFVAAGALATVSSPRAVSALPVPFDPTEEPGFTGLPDAEMDATNGKFLVVVGPNNFSLPGTPGGRGRTVINLAFQGPTGTGAGTLKATPNVYTTSALLPTENLKIAIFDADTDGLWDQRADGRNVKLPPDAVYELFLDGERDGAARLHDTNEANNPELAESHNALGPDILGTDAQWLKVFDRPLDAGAFDPTDGLYHYVLRVTLIPAVTTPPSTGEEVNGFKLAFNGQYSIPRDAIMGFAGGAIDFDSSFEVEEGTGTIIEGSRDPARGTPLNQYDGVFEFPFDASHLCDISDLTVFDADADWNPIIEGVDEDPVGLPPDDGGLYVDPRDPQTPTQTIVRDSSAYRISPQIVWEMVDPDGVVAFSSNTHSPPDANGVRHASVNAPSAGDPFQQTVLPSAAFLAKPGIWRFRWRGVDMRNFVFFGYDAEVGSIPQPGSARGVVFCDDNRNGVQDVGEAGIPDATVTVIALPDAVFVPIQTDAAGEWLMPLLAAGDYRVTITDVPFPAVSGSSRDFTIDTLGCQGSNAVVPIGFVCQERTVCGRVYCDVNQNGFFDAEDEGHENVTVTCRRIVLPGGTVLTEEGTTGIDGSWCITLPDDAADWTASVDPTQPALQGDVPAGPTTLPVGPGEPQDLDFVFFCPGSLSGHVFKEPAGDCLGQPSDGDVPIPGVLVVLVQLDADGEVVPGSEQATSTDAEGFYAFGDLLPGTYRVQIATEPPQDVLVGLTPSSAEVLEPVVEVRTETPDNDFFLCSECVCPDQSDDCSSGYHLVELVVDVFQAKPTRKSWTNPWSTKKCEHRCDRRCGKKCDKGCDKKSGDRSCSCRGRDGCDDKEPTPPPPVRHVVTVSVSGGSVRIAFTGDEWHGSQRDRALTVTDVWAVSEGHWKVRLTLRACDQGDRRGCLAKAKHCVKAVLDCASRLVALDLAGKTCLALGQVTDACGNPWYSVLRWVSCEDSACCPPNPCCSPCGCRPTPCGCSRR